MKNQYNYTPLQKPIPITEQHWPKGTLPIVATSTATFNHVNFIRDCIEGILMQKTTFPVRICIFNDCSTDGTTEIIKEYEEKYPELFWVTHAKENTWRKPTRNEAMKPYSEAREEAKYIAMCEGDDYWTDEMKLEIQVKELENNKQLSMCSHKAKVINKINNKITYTPSLRKDDKVLNTKDIINYWIMPTASYVLRTKHFISNDLNKLKKDLSFGDLPLVYYMSLKGDILYLNNVMSVYHHHLGGITATTTKEERQKYQRRINKEQIIFLSRFNSFTNYQYNNLLSVKISTIYLNLADLYFIKQKYKVALNLITKSFKFNKKIILMQPRRFFVIYIKSQFYK